MTEQQHDYSPLQSLLLVQALAASSSSAAVFDDLSAQLSRSTAFNPSQAQDDARFTPEALKSLYLDLAKQEARREINGARSSPRRRSPTAKSHKSESDAYHGKRAAELVPHLYDEYYAQTVERIRGEERKFDALAGDLDALRTSFHNAAESSPSTEAANGSHALPESSAGAIAAQLQEQADSKQNESAKAAPIGSIITHEEPSSSRNTPLPSTGQSLPNQPDKAAAEPAMTPPISAQSPVKQMLPRPPPSTSHAPHPSNGSAARSERSSLEQAPAPQFQQPPYHEPYPYQQAQFPSPAHQYPPASQSHQQSQPTPQQRGGIMLPPFQLSTDARHSTAAPAKRVSDLNSAQQPLRTATATTPQRRLESAAPYTPLSGPNGSHLRQSGVMVSPGSSTAWKVSSDVPEAPQLRGVSPLSEPEDYVPEKKSTVRKARNSKDASPLTQSRKKAPARTASPSALSVSASSQVDDSFRRPSALRKNEVFDAPGSGDELLTPTAIVKPKRGAAGRTRRRMSTSETNASVDDDKAGSTATAASSRPSSVLVTKNLPKVSKELLEQISSHKHGSMFNDPITNKVAEGYEDYVKVRQDLKSIKAMMQNGAKAINAATAADTANSTLSNSFRLALSEDLMPPHSIVNGAQLEQEIYRMFANSVMFNTGDSDYVDAAREMFADVESRVRAWRDETEETFNHNTVEVEEDVPPPKKRRQG